MGREEWPLLEGQISQPLFKSDPDSYVCTYILLLVRKNIKIVIIKQITLYSVFGEKSDRYHPVLIGCKKNAPNINKCGSIKFQREACLRTRGRVLCTRVIIYSYRVSYISYKWNSKHACLEFSFSPLKIKTGDVAKFRIVTSRQLWINAHLSIGSNLNVDRS